MLIDFAIKKDENYYLQVFLKEYKYIEKNMTRYTTNDFEDSSNSFDYCEEE